MKISDWCLWLSTPGRQLNLSILLGVIAAACFFTAKNFESFNYLLAALIEGVAGFLVLFLAGYSILLSYEMIKKHYK